MKQYHENYGYDLEATLAKHPIKELENNSHRDDLINSLKKGNLQSATFIKDGQEVKQYIEANPQFKSLNIYDDAHKRVDVNQAKAQGESQHEGQRQKESQKSKAEEGDEDGPGEQKEKKQRRKSRSI
ncbi:hypothetical protein OGH69_01685 [Flavobacterium sp. MFBS3-15]|uniref:hypothetical protein n=1 Tax=Flavobacterium sp. MFBS3-15 TaxID=2989816 RepID=UPI0022365E78|nr:hypothetical protein [Flavobacterium sp. MFBS3-15]MCW4467667.1 hypothetical protein [Flavobacterium sp. MFBS3-15]